MTEHSPSQPNSTEAPHVPAAFINAISEEGTKEEAIHYLQKQWNEACALKAANSALRAALRIARDAVWNGGDTLKAIAVIDAALAVNSQHQSTPGEK